MKRFLFTLPLLLPLCAVAESPTVQDVIDRIRAEADHPVRETTVDTIKMGSPDAEVTGIVTTFMPTLAVLKKAVELNCNLIIPHEPLLYNHWDSLDGFENDAVVAAKRQFIEDHKLTIWRFHDLIHDMHPDGIYAGMVRRLEWTAFQNPDHKMLFKLPVETRLRTFVDVLARKYPEAEIRVVGNPDMQFSGFGMAVGAMGSRIHFPLLQKDEVEVLVIGEANEWEAIEYVRDAGEAGIRKALIILGHAISEEDGMAWCAEWIQGIVPEVPVHHVEAGDPFWAP